MFKLILITALVFTSQAEARQAPWVRNRARMQALIRQQEERFEHEIFFPEIEVERGPQGIDERLDELEAECFSFCVWLAQKAYACCCRRPRR